MNIKLRKDISAKIYFNQLKGCLLLNGRLIKPKTINQRIIINLLNSLSVSINILVNKRKKRNIITNKLLLELSRIISKIIEKRNIQTFEDINNINQQKEKNNSKKQIINKQNIISNITKIFSKIFTPFFISFVIFVLIIVLVDYKAIEYKINEPYILKQKELEIRYEDNKCGINGHLPSLKPKCESLLKKIEILKNKKPSLISIIFFEVIDIINNIIENYGIINSVIIFIILISIFIIYRLI
jgi:hypothetical protein